MMRNTPIEALRKANGSLPNNTTNLISVLGATVAEGGTTDRTTTGALAPDLSAAFDLTVDEDPNEPLETDSITIDLSSMAIPANNELHGSDIADLMTKEINRQLGDQRAASVFCERHDFWS